MRKSSKSASVLLLACALAACAGNSNVDTEASPVVAGVRTQNHTQGMYTDSYLRTGDDGVRMTKVLAPAPQVWEALTGAFADRKVPPTILNRASGRVGDTALVMLRRFNNTPLSTYLLCGSNNMTGPRADQDRIRAVLVGQLTRLTNDTVAVAVHFSANATSLNSGGSGSVADCSSTGRLEGEILDDVLRRVGASPMRKT